jgi:hypothetical protein
MAKIMLNICAYNTVRELTMIELFLVDALRDTRTRPNEHLISGHMTSI